MEDIELKKMWAEYDNKLEQAKLLNLQSWALNLQSREALQMHKAQNKLNKAASFKILAVVLGIVWVIFLSCLTFSTVTWQGIIFNISVGMIALITAVAVVVYIRQVILIRQIDESKSIAETQQKLALLQSSTIRIIRILWLQMPFYTTFFITPALLQHGGAAFYIITGCTTGLFTFAAVWLYRNIHYKNRHKKWFKILFNSPEWTNVIKAMQYLEEVEEWKEERGVYS